MPNKRKDGEMIVGSIPKNTEGENNKIKVIVEKDGEKITAKSLSEKLKIVIVINNQFTSAPNTTQIASGAGINSAAGSNAAIDSSNTDQQQSVGSRGS